MSSAKSSLTESTFNSAQLVCFEERYSDGYDIFVNEDYVKWLSLYHPKASPDDLGDNIAPPAPSNTSGPDGNVPVDSSNGSSKSDGESQMDSSHSDSDPDKEPSLMTKLAHFKNNGCDLVLDKDYIRWLTLHHPDALPKRAGFISSPDLEVVLHKHVSMKTSTAIVHQNIPLMQEITTENLTNLRSTSLFTTDIHLIQQEAATPENSSILPTKWVHLKESGELNKSFLGTIRLPGMSWWRCSIEKGIKPLCCQSIDQ